MTWHRIACETGRTPEEAKEQTSSTQFLRWEKFFEDRINDFHREDWFLAQIAYHIFILPYRVWGAKVPEKARVEDFLIKFTSERTGPKEMTEEEKEKDRQERAAMMKAAFFAFTGLDSTGKAIKKAEKKPGKAIPMKRAAKLLPPRKPRK